MKKLIPLLFVLSAVFFSGVLFVNEASAQTLTVTSPNGGETIYAGELNTVPISWNSTGLSGVSAYLVPANGSSSLGVIGHVSSKYSTMGWDGKTVWSSLVDGVAKIVPTGKYKIHLIGDVLNKKNKTISDKSDKSFTIKKSDTPTKNNLSFSAKSFRYDYTIGNKPIFPVDELLLTNKELKNTINIKISIENQPTWLQTSYATEVLPISPGAPMGIGVFVNPEGLSSGLYETKLVISGNFVNSPKTIPITLMVNSASGSCPVFSRSLTLGSSGADVAALQIWLENKGFFVMPAGEAKGYFGAKTRTALAKYQASVGISPADGFLGPVTIAKISADCNTKINIPPFVQISAITATGKDVEEINTSAQYKFNVNISASSTSDIYIPTNIGVDGKVFGFVYNIINNSTGEIVTSDIQKTTQFEALTDVPVINNLGVIKEGTTQKFILTISLSNPKKTGNYSIGLVRLDYQSSDAIDAKTYEVRYDQFEGDTHSNSIVLNATSYTLSILKEGIGSGVVNFPKETIFAKGSKVEITAQASQGSVFAGWSGACSGKVSPCVISMDSDKFVSATFLPDVVQYIKVLSPNGGETVVPGSFTKVTWEASPNINNIWLGYTLGEGHLDWIAAPIANTGSYDWKVNTGNNTNTQLKIYIKGYQTGLNSVSDYSDNFVNIKTSSGVGSTSTPSVSPVRQPRPRSVPTSTSSSDTSTFSPIDLEMGMAHPSVIKLQQYLNSNGFIINTTSGEEGSKGYETNYFGEKTKQALIKFQKSKGIVPAWGFYGSATRRAMGI